MEQETTGSSSPNLTHSDKRTIRTAVTTLLVIVALAIFGGGAYYLGSRGQSADSAASTVLGTESGIIPSVMPSPEPSVPPTATVSATPSPSVTVSPSPAPTIKFVPLLPKTTIRLFPTSTPTPIPTIKIKLPLEKIPNPGLGL